MNTGIVNMDSFTPIKRRFIELTDKETFNKEASFALQVINKSKQLQQCTTESKIEAVMNVANCGLTLNPVMNMAYLVPRWNSLTKTKECHLEPSYQGLVKLITDTGSVVKLDTHLVYDGDDFKVDYSTPTIEHAANPFSKSRGDIVGAYCVATLMEGGKVIEVMTADEINEIRDMSESYKAFKADKIKSCVWEDHYGEMARKTIIKRITKYLPKSDKYQKAANVISLDNVDYSATDGQKNLIESLCMRAAITEDERDAIMRELNVMTAQHAHNVIERLKECQLDSLEFNPDGSTKQINEAVKSKVESKNT